MKKKMIVLTVSSKFGNNCVSGIDFNTGRLIRLVTDDKKSHGALSDDDLTYSDGSLCKVLDVIEFEAIRECPTQLQPENILIDLKQYIKKLDRVTLDKVLQYLDPKEKIHILGNQYSYITENKVRDIGYSLTFVQVKNLIVKQTLNNKGQPKTKVDFIYRDDYYKNLSVTDPNYYSVANGTLISDAYLVISIGASYNDKYYKFVAKIFTV